MGLFKNPFKKETKTIKYSEEHQQLSYGPPTHPKNWLEKREDYYNRFFGKMSDQILHDTTGTLPHIDVYTYPPDKSKGRNFTTIITSGMSDMLQTLPKSAKLEQGGRVELFWYVKQFEIWMADCLVPLAKMPYQYKSHFYYFHTIENAIPNPDQGSELKHIFFMPPYFEQDGFNRDLILDGIPVNFLFIFPITKAEMDYKLEKGSEAFSDLIEKNNPSPVFDPFRAAFL